jgi:hypothetical protein
MFLFGSKNNFPSSIALGKFAPMVISSPMWGWVFDFSHKS